MRLAAVVFGLVAFIPPGSAGDTTPAPFHVVVESFSGFGVGRADCANQRIRLRVDFVQRASVAELTDVIAHEIAHLVTDCSGHTAEWREAYAQARS